MKMYSSAYQSKALELTNTAIPSLCLWAHRGCAGISRQLHPLKVKDLMKDKSGVSFSWYLRYAFLCMYVPICKGLSF